MWEILGNWVTYVLLHIWLAEWQREVDSPRQSAIKFLSISGKIQPAQLCSMSAGACDRVALHGVIFSNASIYLSNKHQHRSGLPLRCSSHLHISTVKKRPQKLWKLYQTGIVESSLLTKLSLVEVFSERWRLMAVLFIIQASALQFSSPLMIKEPAKDMVRWGIGPFRAWKPPILMP